MAPPKADLKSAPRFKHPAFSDDSSETEYTSSSSEDELHDNGNCAESQPKDTTPRSPEKPIQAPLENAGLVAKLIQAPLENSGLVAKSHIKSEDMVASPVPRISPLKGGVLNGQTVTHPPFSIREVGTRDTPLKERHAIDKNGKAIVVVDLGDSDEETDALVARPMPLCTSCQESERHKGHEPQVPKDAEKDEDHTSKLKIVVDLTATSSQVNHTHVAAREVQEGETSLGVMTPFSSKSNGKQVEVEVDFSKEKMNAVSLKANGKQVETEVDFNKEKMNTVSLQANGKIVEAGMDFSNEKMKTVSLMANWNQVATKFKFGRESPLKPHSRIAFSPEVLKAPIEKVRETVLPVAEESEDEASTLSDDYRRGHAEGHHAEMIPPDWSPGVICDLCEMGASLSLGAWYSWCCGNPSLGCSCSFDDQQRKKKALMGKGGKNWKNTDPPYPWSGKVHKLCGLWSAEVFEDSKQPWRIMKLGDAVRRSRKIKCSDPDCGLFGATLGCRVASCRRSFHYPCADRLSALVKVRMWDGLMKPIACKEHRNADDVFEDVKLQKETKKEAKKEAKKRKRGRRSFLASSEGGSSKVGVFDGVDVIQLPSSDEEESPHGATVQDVMRRWNTPNSLDPRADPGVALARTVDTSDSWPRGRAGSPYFGKNLLCTDFSGGLEPIEVPCTNDVDSEPPPYLEYITKSRYQGQPLGSRNCSHPLLERQAKACNGCALYDPDDPFAPMSVHIPFQRREDDFREDWLRERMHGRLPYDKFARLVIGTDYNELVECNDRCKCGDHCINREMQKGLRTPIELYKTVNKGWAVRTLVPIPRGRFVIEYVGEMLTQDQAQRYGQIYDDLKRSYLYDLDYPESKRTPDFTLDGFHASNVARFINHSCDANLKIYRVYVETTYKWLSHIGMYAMRDIEPGEELSYDYNYGRHELQAHDGKSNNSEARKQRIEQQNDSTHIKCYCGAKNCREWLWRPMHTGDDSEDE